MSDPPFSPSHIPSQRIRYPKARQQVWALHLKNIIWTGELLFHGESWGWEAQIVRNGELVIGRRFDMRRLAVQWAEEELDALRKGGGRE